MARIQHYEFGRIIVDGQEERRDLTILPDRVVRNWWRQHGHALVLDDLPEHLVIGTDAHAQLQPDQQTVERLQARATTVESLPTVQAVRRYGELESVRSAAALHLTC